MSILKLKSNAASPPRAKSARAAKHRNKASLSASASLAKLHSACKTGASGSKTSRSSASAAASSSQPTVKSAPSSPAITPRTSQQHNVLTADKQSHMDDEAQHMELDSAVAVDAADSTAASPASSSSPAATTSSDSAPSDTLPSTATPSSSAATDSAAARPSSPSPSASAPLSPGEQKMLATLESVSQKLASLEASVPPLRAQIGNQLVRLCLLRWRAPSLSFDAPALRLAHSRLAYQAAGLDEYALHEQFRLDAVQTDNDDIRRQRKALVQRGNKLSQISGELREQLKRLKRLFPREQPQPAQQQPSKQSAESSSQSMEDVEEEQKTASPSRTPSPAAALSEEEEQEEQQAMRHAEDDDAHMQEEKEEQAPKQAKKKQGKAKSSAGKKTRRAKAEAAESESTASPPAASATATPAPAPAARPAAPPSSTSVVPNPFEQKYASLRLPTYAGPSFRARLSPDARLLLLEADLSGIQSSDVQVVPDVSRRMLTVRGVRLPERRRSVPQDPFGSLFGFGFAPAPRVVAPPEPFGHFCKQISLDELDPRRQFDVARVQAVVNAQHQLQISLPRAPVVQQPAPQVQQQQRAQQQAAAARAQQQQQQQQQRRPVSHSSGVSYDDDDEDDDAPDAYSHPFMSPFASSYAAPYRSAYPSAYYAPRAAPAASPFFGGFW